jgi:hypothetical protein
MMKADENVDGKLEAEHNHRRNAMNGGAVGLDSRAALRGWCGPLSTWGIDSPANPIRQRQEGGMQQ